MHACGVDTVAMESTGVYWISLYELLDARGFKVLLVTFLNRNDECSGFADHKAYAEAA